MCADLIWVECPSLSGNKTLYLPLKKKNKTTTKKTEKAIEFNVCWLLFTKLLNVSWWKYL